MLPRLDAGGLPSARVKPSSATRRVRRKRLRTDLGNAQRLVDQHGGRLRFAPEWGWLAWDDRRWSAERTGEEIRCAKITVRRIMREAEAESDDSRRREVIKHALRSESEPRIRAMLKLAESDVHVVVPARSFDRDPWLLNLLNGTFDLQNGVLRPHDPAEHITKLAPVHYDANAKCPRWDQFLAEITGGNEEIVAYLRRAVGYSLSADVREHALFFCYGTGRNGKTTFLQTLQSLLGDYACSASAGLLLGSRDEADPRSGVAQLFGVRFVVTSEAGEGRRLNENLVKKLTGGDWLRGSHLYREPFEFVPSHKVWLAANHKPIVRGTDSAIWARVKLIPFTVSFEGREDRNLPEKLRTELPGILNWSRRGFREWREHGLGEPAAVRNATAAYRADSDAIGAFIEDECILGTDLEIAAGTLRDRYLESCKRDGERPLSARDLGSRLRDRGCEPIKRARGRCWHGIALRGDAHEA